MRRVSHTVWAVLRAVSLLVALPLTAGLSLWAVAPGQPEAGIGLAAEQAGGARQPEAKERLESTGHFMPTNDWSDRLNSDDYWRARRNGDIVTGSPSFGGWSPARPQPAPPSGLTKVPRTAPAGANSNAAGTSQKIPSIQPSAIKKTATRKDDDADDGESPWTKEESRGVYRTVCVRMCDGYYWPISFATSKDNLNRDTKLCERSCSAPARLYYHENPGQEPDEMEDSRGKPYKDLKVAFLYRKQYDSACTCRADPWDEASLARHQRFAEAADRKAGGRKLADIRAQEKVHAKAVALDAANGAPIARQADETVSAAVVPVRLPVVAEVSGSPRLTTVATARASAMTDGVRHGAAPHAAAPRAAAHADVLKPYVPPEIAVLSAMRRQSLVARQPMTGRKLTARSRAIGVAGLYQTPLSIKRSHQQSSRVLTGEPPASADVTGQQAAAGGGRSVPAGRSAPRPAPEAQASPRGVTKHAPAKSRGPEQSVSLGDPRAPTLAAPSRLPSRLPPQAVGQIIAEGSGDVRLR